MTSKHLFYEVIMKGWKAALFGFQLASWVRNEKAEEEFKNDNEMFSNTAKKIDEKLETSMEEREEWRKVQDAFEKTLRRF